MRLQQRDARDQLPDAELICINIHFDFLESFLDSLEICRYSWAIISGFLKEKLQKVQELLPACAMVKKPVLEETGWITLLLQIDT